MPGADTAGRRARESVASCDREDIRYLSLEGPLDRYAARNANFVIVASDRIAVLAAQSAAKDTANQPRGSAGISRGGAPWLVAGGCRAALASDVQAFDVLADRSGMRPNRLSCACALAIAVALGPVSARPMPPAPQTAAAAPNTFAPHRTPWGDPDLQGIWPSGQMMEVPFERAVELGTQAVLNDEQFAARQADIRQAAETDNAEFVAPGGAATVTPPSHWLERGQASRQASLIVDPPDGRLPPMTEDGQRRAAAWPLQRTRRPLPVRRISRSTTAASHAVSSARHFQTSTAAVPRSCRFPGS